MDDLDLDLDLDLDAISQSLMHNLLMDINNSNANDTDQHAPSTTGGWLSLEDLEKELSMGTSSNLNSQLSSNFDSNFQSAASLIAGQTTLQTLPPPTAFTPDAWSLSLQKFTASSLEQDFLQADASRKKQQQPTAAPPGFDWSQAQDYNENETLVISPPPGWSDKSKMLEMQLKREASTDSVDEEYNDTTRTVLSTPNVSFAEMPKPIKTPQNSISVPSTIVPTKSAFINNNIMAIPEHAIASAMAAVDINKPSVKTTTTTTTTETTTTTTTNTTAPPSVPSTQTPPPVPQVVPTAWAPVVATPIVQPMVPHPRVYANPHPHAPTIPAVQLESKYMKARDIGFVIHGIMRHVLAQDLAVSDYDIQYYMLAAKPKRSAATAGNNNDTAEGKDEEVDEGIKRYDKDFVSRHNKAQEWSQENQVLGATPKTHVSRPRAILAPLSPDATTSNKEGSNSGGSSSVSEYKQRAQLWKARIYIDQAYQALADVVLAWRSTDPSNGQALPANLSQPLTRLLKSLGLARVSADEYTLDKGILSTILYKQLPKGRVLLARVLEQALLPPSAVPALFYPSLEVILPSSESPADDRLFVAWARVLSSQISWPQQVLLDALQLIHKHADRALTTTCRMQCVHALLQRGSSQAEAVAGSEWAKAWITSEEEFTKVLTNA